MEFITLETNDIMLNLINLKQLVFEVTDVCNLRCKYCGYGDLYGGYDPRSTSNLSFEKVQNIIKYLAYIWENNIDPSIRQPFVLSFYGGEPLINMNLIKNLIEYMESIQIIGKKIHYSMTTNGILLYKYMDFLATKKIRLLISLDGNEQNHSYRIDHHGNNSHRQVVDNVKKLQLKYPEYFKKYVRFNTVLHNMNSVESAHKYVMDTFGKKTTISSLNNSGIRQEKVKEFYNMFQNVDASIEKSSNREKLETELFLEAPRISQLTNFIYTFSGNMFDNYRSLFYDENKIETVPTGTCTPFFKKMFITVNGKILPCEKVNHEFAIGQVSDDRVEIDFDQIAEMFNNYVFKFVKQCKTCVNIRKCSQCVFQIDEVIIPAPKCRSYIGSHAFQNYISKNLDYLGKHPALYKQIMKEVRIEN